MIDVNYVKYGIQMTQFWVVLPFLLPLRHYI